MFYQHRIKCMDCGLHFIACSDYENWPNEGTTREQKVGEATGHVYCPECGSTGRKMMYAPVKMDGFIFQFVPGTDQDNQPLFPRGFGVNPFPNWNEEEKGENA